MDYRLTDEDKERVKLLIEVEKNKLKNFSLEQLYTATRAAGKEGL